MAKDYEYPPKGTNPDQWDEDNWWQDNSEGEEQDLRPTIGKENGTRDAALGDTPDNSAPFTGVESILGGGYIPTLKQDYEEKQAKADAAWNTMGGIAKEWEEERLRRAEEIKPRYTQAEIDDRRAKSTAISMLTSALANVANGIAVARGGLNATVPDGYTAAYEHWNDVQKRHDARRQEYDKLLDSVYQNRYGMSKAEYDRQKSEADKAQGYLHAAEMQDQKHKNDMDKLQAGLTADLIKIGAKGEADKAVAETRGKYNVQVANSNNYTKRKIEEEKTKRAEAGKVDLEDYRTYNGTNGTVVIPDDMDVEDGYLAMAKAALDYLDTIQETKENKTDLNNKKKALREALTGSNKDKAVKIKKLSTAIANSRVSQSNLEAALNQTQDDNGGTDDPNAIFG